MSNERRLRAALQGFVTKVRDDRIYGRLGRVNADGTVTVAVETRPDQVYIRMVTGALITLPNVGKGRVPLRAGLPVQMIRLHNGELILDGQDDRLLEDDPYAPDASGVLPHGHALSGLSDVLLTTLADGQILAWDAVAGKWVNVTEAGALVTSVNGQTSAVVLNSDNVAEGLANLYFTAAEETKLAGIEAGADVTDAVNVGSSINTAPEIVTPVNADKVGMVNSAGSVLAWLSWANLKATLKSYFDTLYVALTGNQTIAGNKTFTDNLYVGAAGTHIVDITQNQNAATRVQMTNNNSGASAFATFQAKADVTLFQVGAFSSNSPTTGPQVAGDAFFQSNPGALLIRTVSAHDMRFATSNTERMKITSGGNVGIGATSPQGRLHAHDGTGGFLFVTKTGITATEVELIPDGAGDAVRGVQVQGFAYGSGGSNSGGTVYIATPGAGSITSAFVNGHTAFQIRVYSTGRVTAIRVGTNTETWTASLVLIWL